MPRNQEISIEIRAKIVAYADCGLKQVDIARRVGVNQSVVSRTLKNYRDRGNLSTAKRSGRPRLTSQRTDRMIHRIASIHPMWSAKEIAGELPISPSVRTVQRRLHTQFGLKSYRPAKKPLLSQKTSRIALHFVANIKTGQLKCGATYCSQMRVNFVSSKLT